MDEQAIRKNVRDYLAAFRIHYPRVDLSFASKAFLCTGICKIFEQEGNALDAVRRVSTIPGLRLKGLHCHIGSQLQDTECHEASVEMMVRLLARVKAETGFELDDLNIGGGLGIRYLSDDRPPFLNEFAEAVTGVLKRTLDQAGLRYPTLHLEPGRFLVGETGTTLYNVGSLKQIPNIRDRRWRTFGQPPARDVSSSL